MFCVLAVIVYNLPVDGHIKWQKCATIEHRSK